MNQVYKYLNLDLSVISQWAYQWKIFFNLGPKKPVHKVIFSRKKNETHASVFYNNIEVSCTDSQKHLGLVLDKKITFKKHIKDKLKHILVLVRLKDFLIYCLAILSLLFIYHLLGHIWIAVMLYLTNQIMIHFLIEQLQCKACLAITEAIQGTSQECLYNELGLEILSTRRWYRKVCAIYKLLAMECPKSLFNILVKAFMIYARNRDLFSTA